MSSATHLPTAAAPQPGATRVEELARAVGGTYVGPSSPGSSPQAGQAAYEGALVYGITHDSRCVTPGALFCCVVGQHHDGHRFAPQALAAGATAVLVSRRLDLDVPQIVVSDVRAALGPASAAVWGQPWRQCRVVGVTGTSGKTTVAHAVADLARACGTPCEVMGTLDGARTTPEAPQLCRRLRRAVDAGAEMVVLEVSSHALALGRLNGARFAAGVFTNLSHEHLDFHRTMEDYFAAKARLFDGRSAVAVLNVADAWGRRLSKMIAGTTDLVATWQPSDIEQVTVSPVGISGRWRGHTVRSRLLGRINAANLAAAAATASALGFDDDAIAAAMPAIAPVRGRLWPVSGTDDDITVLVDFAHKPDALAAALRSARELCAPAGRLWAVFGAGGDRDQSKRAPMGAAAHRHADMVVLTSDNPRSEDPARIAADIAEGVRRRPGARGGLHVELDRSAAIAFAVDHARAGDVVVVAGKGHETSQTIGNRTVPFDDAAAAGGRLQQRRRTRR
ncbi:UDP-N-acetylmuramoyl-L-alanyl-D-glutamate--2,6-diaminopimelate ligase [Candidatus Poriferisodalis sp.]|uniref:UDP-N-acetylmuramoyl-L-alanyl-D-glutamate--2, 6-diaminopimelate ligase n=1 Tax=Candidatus Poriferisodalis sp. TaxID=3101277 RepID=UPI003B01E265